MPSLVGSFCLYGIKSGIKGSLTKWDKIWEEIVGESKICVNIEFFTPKVVPLPLSSKVLRYDWRFNEMFIILQT